MSSPIISTVRTGVGPAVIAVGLVVAAPLFGQLRERRFGEPRPSTQPNPAQLPPSFGEQLEQATRRPPENLRTFVEFTVLTPRFGAALDSQRWAKALTDLGVEARFRPPVAGDKPGLEEQTRGTFRTVSVIGRLTEDGQLEFDNQVFTPDDQRRLKEWIDELKTYGAQGAPQGQPLWGLSQTQFTGVYESLSLVVEDELEGLPLNEALRRIPLPPAHPLRNSVAADEWLAAHPARRIENRVQGLSSGTVLAIVLSEAGLGFHPLRTPDGRLELSVQPLSAGGQTWPVGWGLAEDVDHGQLVPILHKFSEIGFDDAALQDVLDATGAAIEVPILVDYHAVRDSGVNLADKSVSFPLRRTTWALMLNSVIRKANLIKEVRTDERGRAFVFVAPFVPTRVEGAR